ncbi:Predicted membrane protein [Prochlorococcus marinus str. MIT 9515]|uniref:Predicted membrane protein n=1 Tax=Prochlorococcus marinus (strain MIT 9515) TaxID=167542 RepID=A2BU61_PROM5|nr:vitamin K epoxide reductase family protein [Prochlorococcus marinus]ABM71322.1 Predicted membrane protein [Prochlorococcus marinus str. MIT 9515]
MAIKTLKSRNKKDLKWPKIIIAVISTIGLVDTGSITLKNWGVLKSLSCPGINNGCEKVLNSPWGTLFENSQFNIPLSLAGVITYSLILGFSIFLSLNIISHKEKLNKLLWWLIFLISCASSVFSILLINIMFFKIKAYCFFCILSAIISISIFIFSMIGAKFESREPMFFRGFIVFLTVLIGGLIWSNNVDPSNAIDISNSSEKVSPAITTLSSPQKVKFAKFLSDNNIKMFSAYWCPHCLDQKKLFGKKAVKELTVIECAKDGKDNQYKLCREKQIEGFPSWEINGEIYSGVKDLNELATITGYEGDSNF